MSQKGKLNKEIRGHKANRILFFEYVYSKFSTQISTILEISNNLKVKMLI